MLLYSIPVFIFIGGLDSETCFFLFSRINIAWRVPVFLFCLKSIGCDFKLFLLPTFVQVLLPLVTLWYCVVGSKVTLEMLLKCYLNVSRVLLKKLH